MDNSPVIMAKNLTKTVDSQGEPLTILRGVDLNVKAGESLAVVGASGSGKSTLLGLLAGLDEASSGEIWLAGEPVHRLGEEDRAALRAKKVGFVFQNFLLVAGLTAMENVMLPLELAGVKDGKRRALDLLEKVGLGHRHHHYPNQLSGGEQQRVAIARAFITKPAILFADEPTGNLDGSNGQRIADLLFQLNHESGTTLIVVTHDMKLAGRCQRRLYMQDGELGVSAEQGVSTKPGVSTHVA
jgi:putative ABC transport system ATP-binding protein